MVTVSVRFLAGRFHATPWGRHVNEGVPEWPPAPWRLLRALLATWKRTCPSVDENRIAEVLEPLKEPPLYSLPPATASHVRYFQPWEKKGPRDRTFVIDTFVAVPRSETLLVAWPNAELDDQDRDLLSRLLEGLDYLGRSESWCDARLLEDWQFDGDSFWSEATGEVRPLNGWPLGEEGSREGGERGDGRTEIVSVLGVEPSASIEQLLVRTGELRRSRNDPSYPPGSRWLDYRRPEDCFEVTPVDEPPAVATGQEPTVVRWAFDSSVLPRITDAVAWAGVARAATMSVYGDLHGGRASPLLAGKDEDGEPLTGHEHAFYLPTDEDLDGQLDHLLVWVPGGLGPEERRAVGALDRLYPEGGTPEIRLVQEGMGEPVDFDDSPYLGLSRRWLSVTPFVLFRHPKRSNDGSPRRDDEGRWIDGPVDQLRRACRYRGFPEPSRIDAQQACRLPGTSLRWTEFQQWRKRGPNPARTEGYGFDLEFDEPLEGPLTLGYASHFALGLFRAVD